MKSVRVMILAAVLLISATAAFAASNDVLIVYDRVDATASHTMQFIAGNARYSGMNLSFKAAKAGTQFNPADFKAVIVLNTGVRSGVDSALQGVLDQTKGADNVILLSLYRGSNNYQVNFVPSNQSSNGIDAISAASRWGGGNIMRMHQQWLQDLYGLLQSM